MVDADTLVRADAVEQVFVVRTTGPDCQLDGVPTVTVLRSGQPLQVELTPSGPFVSPRDAGPVTLSVGSSASFGLGTARRADCTTADRVDVVLPGTSVVHRVSTALEVCDGRLSVSAVGRRADTES